MTHVKVQRKDVISDQEVEEEIKSAEKLAEFPRLRAKATVAFLETGKRRRELVCLEHSDITSDEIFLYVRFTVVKKRKKNVNVLQRVKKFRRDSKWARYILEYLAWLKEKHPNCKYVYPRTKCLFGKIYIFDETQHAEGQEIWRIIKILNLNDWPHQHREKRAVKVIRMDERKFGEAKLETIYRIRNVLDLEREQTAYNYIRRHETQKVEEEEEVLG
jgi:hypothetical protein